MSKPLVSIVVAPRDRFCLAQKALESIYTNSDLPFDLIYIDGNSPPKVRRYLETEAQTKGFRLIQFNHYVTPNQARNIGLYQSQTKYTVFIENDMAVAPGWLSPLVECAETTGAKVVGPMTCQYMEKFDAIAEWDTLPNIHNVIHCAGGEYFPSDRMQQFIQAISVQDEEWRVQEQIYLQNHVLSQLKHPIQRQKTDFVETHCLMADTEFAKQFGGFDEQLYSNKEYLDFCMSATRLGGDIYLEPQSVVTFMTHKPTAPLEWSDLHYFMLRWSDAWEIMSLNRFREKWNLENDKFFHGRFNSLGWRRQRQLILALNNFFDSSGTKKIPSFIEKLLRRSEKILNRYLTHRFATAIAGLDSPERRDKTLNWRQRSSPFISTISSNGQLMSRPSVKLRHRTTHLHS